SQIRLENIMKKMSIMSTFALSLCLMLTASVMAYQNNNAQTDSRKMQTQVASGQKMKLQGTILKRDNDTFTVRDNTGSEVTVRLAANTKVEEKKSNPFRGSKKY